MTQTFIETALVGLVSGGMFMALVLVWHAVSSWFKPKK